MISRLALRLRYRDETYRLVVPADSPIRAVVNSPIPVEDARSTHQTQTELSRANRPRLTWYPSSPRCCRPTGECPKRCHRTHRWRGDAGSRRRVRRPSGGRCGARSRWRRCIGWRIASRVRAGCLCTGGGRGEVELLALADAETDLDRAQLAVLELELEHGLGVQHLGEGLQFLSFCGCRLSQNIAIRPRRPVLSLKKLGQVVLLRPVEWLSVDLEVLDELQHLGRVGVRRRTDARRRRRSSAGCCSHRRRRPQPGLRHDGRRITGEARVDADERLHRRLVPALAEVDQGWSSST